MTKRRAPSTPFTGTADDLVSPYGQLDGDYNFVICHICGRNYRCLGHHVNKTHGISPDAYRELTGLNRNQALTSPAQQEKDRKKFDRVSRNDPAWQANMGRLARESDPRCRVGNPTTWRQQERTNQMPSRAEMAERKRGIPISPEQREKQSRAMRGYSNAQHGTLSRYGWGCRCALCRKATTDHRREYDRAKREQRQATSDPPG